jgi:hypothetical protein
MSDITGDQSLAIDFHDMAPSQHADRGVDAPEGARNDGFADTGRAGKHHVQAHRRDRQALLAPPAFDLKPRGQAIDLLLDLRQPRPSRRARRLPGPPVGIAV